MDITGSGSMPLLLRVGDAARLLAIGRSKAYRLVGDGTLPAIRVGESIRIPRDALLQWISEQLDASSNEPGVARKEDW